MKLSHWGRVMGPVGLVFLLVSGLTKVLAGDSGLGWINFVLGVICVAFYLVTNLGELRGQIAGRGAFYTAVSAVTTGLLAVGLLAANYLSIKHPKSWDVTQNKIHTLAQDTVNTVQGLKQPVEVLGFFKPGEPQLDAWTELLERYKALNGEKFTYKIVDPDKEPKLVSDNGIRSTGPRVVVRYDKQEAKVSAPSEEELTNALVKVTHAQNKKIYFLDGHGEASIDSREQDGYAQLVERMKNEGLNAEKLPFGGGQVPADAAAVVIAGPQKPLLNTEVEMLKKYLDEGGRVIALVDPMTTTNLDSLLKDYGVSVDPGIIVDQAGRSRFDTPFAAIGVPGEHPITKGFRLATVFPQAASLTLAPSGGVSTTPLMETLGAVDGQPVSWVEAAAANGAAPSEKPTKMGPLTLGAVATKAVKKDQAGKRSDEARLIVIGDHDFATNGNFTVLGNADFALNVMNWAADQTDRISIRPRQREASRLFLTAAQMGGIRFFATELPIGLLALGLAIFFNRRAK